RAQYLTLEPPPLHQHGRARRWRRHLDVAGRLRPTPRAKTYLQPNTMTKHRAMSYQKPPNAYHPEEFEPHTWPKEAVIPEANAPHNESSPLGFLAPQFPLFETVGKILQER